MPQFFKLIPITLTVLTFYFTTAAPARADDEEEFPTVPYPHWAYAEIGKLSRAGLLPGFATNNGIRPLPLTRYEFAVATARLLSYLPPGAFPDNWPGYDGANDHLKSYITSLRGSSHGIPFPEKPLDLGVGGQPAVYTPEILTAIEALRREFKAEVTRLNARVDQLTVDPPTER
jgi:hypothetical protein